MTGESGVVRTFGAGGSPGMAATTAAPGHSYRFRAQATDPSGNTTGVTVGAGCVVGAGSGKDPVMTGPDAPHVTEREQP